jgi:hypothetical protein
MSDRLALANAIEDAGIPRDKAERVASVIVDLVRDSAATKADVQDARTDLKADIAALRSELKAQPNALMLRLGGLMVVLSGLLFAALHYWPPHG